MILHVNSKNLSEILSKAEDFFSGLDKEKRYKAMLVCDEILTNQIKHGEFKQEVDIKLNLYVKNKDVKILFSDNAKKFNPLQNDTPNLTTTLDETQMGGLGIFLVKEYAKEITYSYKNGYNILEVVL